MTWVEFCSIAGLIFGPLLAVWWSEESRRKWEFRERKHRIFRTLMSTRSTQIAIPHVEALNLVQLEFHSASQEDKRVIDALRLYLQHLDARNNPDLPAWNQRKQDLLADLLYQMSGALGYDFDKATILAGAYYPQAHLDVELQQKELLRGLADLVSAKSALNVIVHPPVPPTALSLDKKL